MLIFKNKKGASLSSVTELAVGMVVLLLCLALVIQGFNDKYGCPNGNNCDKTFGISTNDTRTRINNYKDTLQEGLQGEASTNQLNGLSLSTAWGMIRAGIDLTWRFASGQMIQNAVGLLQLGEVGIYLAWGLWILFILAMGFVLLKILFKVKP